MGSTSPACTRPARAAPALSLPHYGYRLLLPPDWQVETERSGPALRLPIGSTLCNLRALPPMPREQRAYTVPVSGLDPV